MNGKRCHTAWDEQGLASRENETLIVGIARKTDLGFNFLDNSQFIYIMLQMMFHHLPAFYNCFSFLLVIIFYFFSLYSLMNWCYVVNNVVFGYLIHL